MMKDSVSYTDAVDILMPTLGIPADRRPGFESRLRHVQLIQARAGRTTKRIRYDLDEIALVGFAFTLMGAHLPPRLAIRHIIERRTPTLRLLHAAIGRGEATLVIPGNGLEAIGEAGQDENVPLPRATWFSNVPKATRAGPATLIEVGGLMRSISTSLNETIARNAQRREAARLKRVEYCRAAARRSNAAKAAAREIAH